MDVNNYKELPESIINKDENNHKGPSEPRINMDVNNYKELPESIINKDENNHKGPSELWIDIDEINYKEQTELNKKNSKNSKRQFTNYNAKKEQSENELQQLSII
ncbi:8294_t:CDS:1, partial [Entrophospora sp. SA101]